MDDEYRARVFRSSIIESLCLPVLAFVGGIVFTWMQNNALGRAVGGPIVLMAFACFSSPLALAVLLIGPAIFCIGLYTRRSIFAYLGMVLLSAVWLLLVQWANVPRPLTFGPVPW